MIEILRTDITILAVDAIVNAANNSLLGGGGVDGAIHRAAGSQLLEACRALGGCASGKSKITPGFNLPAKFVIHTVGPVWSGGKQGEAELLQSAYRNCFELALENDVHSIAFPAISTGVYGFPKRQATKIALSVMADFEEKVERIIAVCFSEEDSDLYKSMLPEQAHYQNTNK